MPTYQYVCSNPDGKHEFEVVQSFTDAPVAECPQCGTPVRKVYGSVGVVFKGSGFYRTDNRPSSSSSSSGAGNGNGKSGESKSSDGKPAETKSSDSKSSDSKPSSTPAAAPAAAAK